MRAPLIVVGALVGASVAAAAAAQPPVSLLGSCAGEDLRGFTIRSARLDDRFWILRWRRPGDEVLSAIHALAGQPYSFAAVNAVSVEIEKKTWLPDDPEAIVQLQYSDIGLEHCRERQLDVVFRIFSAAPSPTLSTVFEWGARDKTPDQTAGLARTNAPWLVAPEVGFDRARELAAGGRVKRTWANSRTPFNALIANGLVSAESHVGSASLIGGDESPERWLRRTSWRVTFRDASDPAGDVHLDDRRLAAQFSGTSRPAGGIVMRFGGVLDGGRLESGFGATELPAHTAAASDFTQSSVYAGVTGRRSRQSFTATYALMLGATGAGFHGDWRKHIGDAAHEFWWPIRDHRLFEVEQRLTAGRLDTLGVVPASERFFGGANDASAQLGEDWRLPIGPRIRSLPTNAFSVTGAGGDRFVSYNSTVAFTVWGKPAVPPELSNDEAFGKQVHAQLTNARSVLEAVYRSGDENFQAIKARMPEIVDQLTRAAAAEAAARSSSSLPEATFRPCEQALRASRMAATHAAADKPAQAYGWVEEMLPDGNNALVKVASRCGEHLADALRRAGVPVDSLVSASNAVQTSASFVERRFADIDQKSSAKRAADDLAYAQHAIDIILTQLNITSISPVFVFDVARLAPAGDDPYGGDRYAVGGGLRFTLASTVSMTVTYAANPRRRPGEGSGALVFSLTTRNLFD
jgi:hypothetical protein